MHPSEAPALADNLNAAFVQSPCSITATNVCSTDSKLPQPAASTVKVTKEYDFAGETVS